jgi:hypothetical protein
MVVLTRINPKMNLLDAVGRFYLPLFLSLYLRTVLCPKSNHEKTCVCVCYVIFPKSNRTGIKFLIEISHTLEFFQYLHFKEILPGCVLFSSRRVPANHVLFLSLSTRSVGGHPTPHSYH